MQLKTVSSDFANLPVTERPPFPGQTFAANTWVKLLYPPTDFSFDEAWLLCKDEQDQWLAWIPDYGTLLLDPEAIALL
jgi:hypothetical protein